MATRTKSKPKPAAKAKPKPAASAKRSKPATKKGREPRAKVTPGEVIPIETFGPEPYDLKRPILVVVRRCRREYAATFFDAALTGFGFDKGRAVEKLKMVILHNFDMLSAEGQRLAPALANRLAVLRDFITKRE